MYNSVRIKNKILKETKFRTITATIVKKLPNLVKLYTYYNEYII